MSCVRTASGSDRILRTTQKRPSFRKLHVIRSLPLAVLTRLVATLTFNYTQARSAQVCYGVGICDADHKSAKKSSAYDKPMTIETPIFLE